MDRAHLVGNNTQVIEIPNNGEVEESLFGWNIRDIGCPLLVGPVRMEVSVQEILIAVKGLAVMDISPSPHLRQKSVFSHNTEDCLGVMVDSLPLQPDVDAAVSISFPAGSLAFADLLCKRQISCRRIHPLDKIIVSASGHLKKRHIAAIEYLSLCL